MREPKYFHDQAGYKIGSTVNNGCGETRVYSADGSVLGSANEHGTYDAGGVKLSNDNCPGMLLGRK